MIASIPFADRVNFRTLSRSQTKEWTPDDYGKYMIRNVMMKKIIPELQTVPELKGK